MGDADKLNVENIITRLLEGYFFIYFIFFPLKLYSVYSLPEQVLVLFIRITNTILI